MSMLSVGLSPTPDPTTTLTEQLHEATTLHWRAILSYREAMAGRGETVVFAPYGGEIDMFVRLLRTPLGGELVVLGRASDAGFLWDAVSGAGVPAAVGDTVLHGLGVAVEAWQVYGRYRRIATAAHPDNPAEPVHVLHRLDGTD
jgi:hypothetical protein